MLPNGPVGQNGSLASGDELLEVNGRKLLGLYHADVVTILKVTLIEGRIWIRVTTGEYTMHRTGG